MRILVTECDSDHCWPDANGLYKCEGKAGEEIIVPCGPYRSESDDVTFTYTNMTSGLILSSNSTDCLRVNLTVYDDEAEISCEPSNEHGATYSYDLSVECEFILDQFQ